MILTGKAVEFAENFEKLEEKLEESTPDEEITEEEQITLFMINKMFVKEAAFRDVIGRFTSIYADMRAKGIL